MNTLLAWLASLPTWALYLSLAATAAAENVFPPLPADTVVGVGSFLAARGSGSLVAAAASVWAGNLLGAMGMYFVGRRYGSAAVMKRMGGPAAEARVATMYASYGILALFVSRFLPGIRAVVPPVAGALRIPLRQVLPVMAVASALWYGAIAWIGFRFGENLERLQALIASTTRASGMVALAIVVVTGGVVWYRIRRARPPT